MSHRHRRKHRHGIKSVQSATTAPTPAAKDSSSADAAASASSDAASHANDD